MKKILLVIIIFFPVFCFGQVKNDTTTNELDSLFSQSKKSLIVIDGVIFDGLHISDVDLSNVSDMTILRGEYAIYIYGDKGKNGAIIITTKETKQQVEGSQNSEDNGSAVKKKKISKSKNDIGLPISLNVDKILERINLRKIEESISSLKIVDVNLPAKMNRNIFIVDGYILEEEEIMSLKVENLESISVLRSDPPGFDSKYSYVEVTIKNGVEYEATVLDTGFDSFLATQKSKDYYSIASLKARNEYLVSEWNHRCGLPSVYNPNVYEQKIDYESQLDYGLDVEYIVYMFFKFMAEENNIRFDTTFI